MRISSLKEQIHNSIIIDSEVLYVRHLNGKPKPDISFFQNATPEFSFSKMCDVLTP
jgi:hypothetical protein